MNKGFLSFVLCAVFLLAIVSSGLLISGVRPDYSYERYRTALVDEVAIKQAYYSSVAQAAREALRLSAAASEAGVENDPRGQVRAAILAQTAEFESQLQREGFDALFWCGSVSEEERQLSSQEMAAQKKALLPSGTLAIGDCAGSFEVDIVTRKAYFRNVGFSFYDPGLGIGEAAVLPPSFEADFNG